MVTVKQEVPPSPGPAAAAAAASSNNDDSGSGSGMHKRKRVSARLSKQEGAAMAAVAIKAEVKEEAALKGESDDCDETGLLAKLRASWSSLDMNSTASEESPCTCSLDSVCGLCNE